MIEDVLAEREKTHGSFKIHAHVTQEIKRALAYRMSHMTDIEREATEMIAHKLGRIVAGNAHFVDHWVDIAGYAQLVVNELSRPAGLVGHTGDNPLNSTEK